MISGNVLIKPTISEISKLLYLLIIFFVMFIKFTNVHIYRVRAALLERFDRNNTLLLLSCFEDILKKDPTCSDALAKLIKMHQNGTFILNHVSCRIWIIYSYFSQISTGGKSVRKKRGVSEFICNYWKTPAFKFFLSCLSFVLASWNTNNLSLLECHALAPLIADLLVITLSLATDNKTFICLMIHYANVVNWFLLIFCRRL